MKNVGVIKRGLVAKVVRFYGYVDYINSFQALRKQYEDAGHADEFNTMYLRTLETLVDTFSDLR